ncbi:MAG: Cbb3-type cytochrome oxidase component FixQ, partial [uncultured Ramlibacter sp.]
WTSPPCASWPRWPRSPPSSRYLPGPGGAATAPASRKPRAFPSSNPT